MDAVSSYERQLEDLPVKSRDFLYSGGDAITTGTPAGIGMGQKPEKIFLRPCQTVRLEVQGLGQQQQRTVADR